MSTFLYLIMILAWGFSWIAIKWQGTDVPMEVSILYRFAIATAVMFIIGISCKKLQKVSLSQHKFIALQGGMLFCCNFLAFYSATSYIASGLAAVVMASIPVFNAVHGKLFYKTPCSANFWLGVCVGLAGIGMLFSAELENSAWSADTLIGLGYALLGTWCFSLGNMLSIRSSRNNIHPFTSTSYAMLYGCAALLLIIFFKDLEFTYNSDIQYLASLLYLAIPASVIGFTCYLILVDRIGANHASYLLVITPVVALIISAFYEGYQWTIYSSMGLVLVVMGNIISKRQRRLSFNLSRKKLA